MADSILETNSLVPRPHLPQAEEDSLVTVEGFLGSADSAMTGLSTHHKPKAGSMALP